MKILKKNELKIVCNVVLLVICLGIAIIICFYVLEFSAPIRDAIIGVLTLLLYLSILSIIKFIFKDKNYKAHPLKK